MGCPFCLEACGIARKGRVRPIRCACSAPGVCSLRSDHPVAQVESAQGACDIE